MKFTVLFRRVLLALAGLFFSLGANSGATILVWPIDPWLAAERNASELWIENRGDAPTTMQVRIVRWRQQGGGRALSESARCGCQPTDCAH